jgi:PAS domain S-box-containing protein
MLHTELDQLDEQWLRCLFQQAPVPLAVVAPNHRFLRCNDAYCKLLGYARAELLARTWKSITHQDDIDGYAAGAGELKTSSTIDSYTVNKRYITKFNEVISVSLFVQGIYDDNKLLHCYFVTAIPLSVSAVKAPAEPQPRSLGFVEWARNNPRDATIVALAASLFLGRDGLIDLLKLFFAK